MSAMEYYVRKNISEENIMEKLVENESDKNRSILFASKTLCIRKNLYYILARSIKVSSITQLNLYRPGYRLKGPSKSATLWSS